MHLSKVDITTICRPMTIFLFKIECNMVLNSYDFS